MISFPYRNFTPLFWDHISVYISNFSSLGLLKKTARSVPSFSRIWVRRIGFAWGVIRVVCFACNSSLTHLGSISGCGLLHSHLRLENLESYFGVNAWFRHTCHEGLKLGRICDRHLRIRLWLLLRFLCRNLLHRRDLCLLSLLLLDLSLLLFQRFEILEFVQFSLRNPNLWIDAHLLKKGLVVHSLIWELLLNLRLLGLLSLLHFLNLLLVLDKRNCLRERLSCCFRSQARSNYASNGLKLFLLLCILGFSFLLASESILFLSFAFALVFLDATRDVVLESATLFNRQLGQFEGNLHGLVWVRKFLDDVQNALSLLLSQRADWLNQRGLFFNWHCFFGLRFCSLLLVFVPIFRPLSRLVSPRRCLVLGFFRGIRGLIFVSSLLLLFFHLDNFSLKLLNLFLSLRKCLFELSIHNHSLLSIFARGLLWRCGCHV